MYRVASYRIAVGVRVRVCLCVCVCVCVCVRHVTNQGRTQEGYKWIYILKLAKLDLTTDAKYAANMSMSGCKRATVQCITLVVAYAIPT